MEFNDVHSHEFDAALTIRTIAIHASSSGGLDIISAKVPPKKNNFTQSSAERAVLQAIALTQVMKEFIKTPGLYCVLTSHVAAAAFTDQALAPAAPLRLHFEVSLTVQP